MAQDSTELAHTARLTDMVNSLNQDFAKKTSEGAAIKAKDLEVMHLKSAQAELHDRLEKLEAEKQTLNKLQEGHDIELDTAEADARDARKHQVRAAEQQVVLRQRGCHL